MLDFVSRLTRFAPFNAMLLHLQKPGLSYAASARDWLLKFGRRPKDGARPLLILQPFGPVALLYDVQDTEGRPVPEGVFAFTAKGSLSEGDLRAIAECCKRQRVAVTWVDAGDHLAGYIGVETAPSSKTAGRYALRLNRNHALAAQFATLTHELAHLYLGHLGGDRKLKIPDRAGLQHAARELEAESVCYLVSMRRGIEPQSVSYLSQFFRETQPPTMPDSYHVMRVAGIVERMINARARPGKASRRRAARVAKPVRPMHEEQTSFDFPLA